MPSSALSEIARKLRDKELILFVGSGMSAPYFPTWAKLLENLQSKAFEHDPTGAAEVAQMIKDNQFLNAAWAIQHKAGESGWRSYIEATFSSNPADDSPAKQIVERKYAALKGLPFASVVTTNYDGFLAPAIDAEPITHEDADQISAMPRKRQLLKLHGSSTKPKTLILTSTDFSKMKLGRDAVDEFRHSAAKDYSFLFLGYSFEDEDVLWWLERACYRAQGNIQGHYGLIDGRKWGQYKRDLYLQRYGIQMIDAPLDSAGKYPDIEAFLHQLREAWQQEQSAPIAKRVKPLVWPRCDEYVDPQVLARKDKSLHSLDAFLIDWLKSPDPARQFLVLLGEFGTGKTQFSYRAEQLVRRHSTRTPVLVELGQSRFHKGADAGAIAAAAAPGDESRFLNANKDGQLVLILDAFDEMGKASPAQSIDSSGSDDPKPIMLHSTGPRRPLPL